MSITVFDESGQRFEIGSARYTDEWDQPLVVEQKNVFSYPFGNAEVVQLFFPGVSIVYGDTCMYQNRRLRFEMVDEPALVEMHFTLAGTGTMINDLNGQTMSFKANEHNLHFTPNFVGYGHFIPQQQYLFFEVHFTQRFFLELAADSSPSLMQFAEKIQSGNLAQLSNTNLTMSFAMHQCIQEIMNNKLTGKLKLLFLQSKCIELLALQAQMHEDVAGRSSGIICKTGYDKDCIHFAKDYLVQHVQEPPSLTELAKIAGLNEFKLKQGFKEVFNTTVFGYLSDYKLAQARDLLLQGQLPIKEIAVLLGYSSVQHFNNAFRKKFGLPPGKVRR